MTEPAWRSRARRAAARLRRRSAAPSGAPARLATTTTPAQRVLASGVFDRAYYEIQTGTAFGSDEAAVRDFLQQGHRLGLSPHPLFEPEWFRRERPRNRPNTLLAYLDEGGGEHGPGPLFGEDVYLGQVPDARRHPGGALGHFLARAGDDDLLPTPTDHRAARLTWGEARRLAYESAAEFRRFEDLRSTPRRGPWDEAADGRFVHDWLARGHRARPDGSPSVSVVMPVRNRPVQVLEAIASVQDQTLADWELIVVDDGSTDHTPEVIEGIAAADPRVRLVRREQAGVSAARNAGIAAATGEWLAFLDSDNTWVPHFLQVMVTYLEEKDIRAGHAVIDTMGEPTEDGSGRYLALDGGLEHLLVKNHIDLNGFMLQTRLAVEVGGFDEALRRWVDHDLAIRVARRTGVPLVPFVGVRYDHSFDAPDRITTTEPNHWEWVVLGKHHVDWDRAIGTAGERRIDLVSVCMPSLEDWAYTRVAIEAVLGAGSADLDIEVVLLVNSARRCVGTILRALYADEPRVRILSVTRNLSFSVSANLAFTQSRGRTVVFLDNDTEVLAGWLQPLLETLEEPEVLGAQALLLHPDGSVQHAGWAFTGAATLPTPLLDGHPVEDVVRLAPLRMQAVAASALAMRAEDVLRLRGFDPSFVNGCEDIDLCLRAVGDSAGRFVVVPDSRVVHHRRGLLSRRYERDQDNRRTWMRRWAAAPPPSDLGVLETLGYDVAHLDPGEPVEGPRDVRMPRPVVVRPAATVPDGPAAGRPRLRWALKTPTPLRETGGSADLDLAAALADALVALGQDVVVDRLESHQRRSSYLDDVVVALRGPDPAVDEGGRPTVAWLIDAGVVLEAAETMRYDAVLTITEQGPALLTATGAGEQPGTPVEKPDPAQLAAAAGLLLDRAVEIRSSRPWVAARPR